MLIIWRAPIALDMAAAGWVPTVDNYLGRVPKTRILEAVREAKGERSAQLIDHLKKGDMASEAERLLADSGWLPEPLRTPEIDAPSNAARGRRRRRGRRCFRLSSRLTANSMMAPAEDSGADPAHILAAE